jgi:hypothetical protein
MKCLNALPTKLKQSPFNNLELAQRAWENAKGAIRKIHGAKDLKSFHFNDSSVIEATQDAAGAVVVTLRSPKRDATERGIAKHWATIALTMGSFYGLDVKLTVLGLDLEITPISGQLVNAFTVAAAT